jgi:HNH endonuclease
MWLLFEKACGGRCCICSNDGPLHRGHILRHADGGTAVFENLIPLCKSCNSKYKNGFTPDARPADWRDVFLKLLLAQMSLGIMYRYIQPCTSTSLADKIIENNGFLDLQAVKFAHQSDYKVHQAGTRTVQPMRAADATKLMWRLFDKGKQNAIPPKRPFAKRQDAMKLLAIRHGEVAFMLAGEEFLLEQPWVLGSEERGGAAAASDSWLHFCESFDGYLADARARAVRLAQQAKIDRERKLADDAQGVVYERRMRWNSYIRTADVPHWPGMLDGDAAIIADVAARKAAQPQDITNEQYEQSLAVFRRWTFFKKDELLDERQRLRGKLTQCAAWAKQHRAEEQQEYVARIKQLMTWIDTASMDAIRKYSWWVDELHASLDPALALDGDPLELF